jgi:hypothetical protein
VTAVPEIRRYSRQEIGDGVIIRYLMRMPGERDWTPVKLVVPAEDRRRCTPHENADSVRHR